MKALSQIHLEAKKLYSNLEIGSFFNTYHDMMIDLVEKISYLEEDIEGDMELALEYLDKCKAIAKAQQLLLTAKIN
jgi:hypothetical protein